jgi:LPS export ABC transporter protein LptC
MRFLIILTVGLLCYSCKNDLETTKKEKNNLGARTEIGKNIEVNYSERGIKTAILRAPTMVKQEDTANKTYFPDGLKLDMFDSLGMPSSTLTARYGEHDHSTNQMKARDSVSVVSTNGQTLKTKELIWLQNENRMISYGAVEIRNKNEIIYGDTLYADENLKKYTVKKIRGIVHVTK